jgi:hypothetical protein
MEDVHPISNARDTPEKNANVHGGTGEGTATGRFTDIEVARPLEGHIVILGSGNSRVVEPFQIVAIHQDDMAGHTESVTILTIGRTVLVGPIAFTVSEDTQDFSEILDVVSDSIRRRHLEVVAASGLIASFLLLVMLLLDYRIEYLEHIVSLIVPALIFLVFMFSRTSFRKTREESMSFRMPKEFRANIT